MVADTSPASSDRCELKPNGEELAFFARRFDHSESEILRLVDRYNNDYAAYDNRIYEHVGSRIAHWWNYARAGWFDDRIDIFLEHLKRLVVDHGHKTLLIDVGYSVPYAYTRHSLRGAENLHIIHVDKEKSAKQFFSAVGQLYGIERHRRDHAVTADIESAHDRQRIVETAYRVIREQGIRQVLVVASEVVEHLDDRFNFWRFVEDIHVRCTRDRAVTQVDVYCTLPVGEKIPSHTVEFRDAQAAFSYLSGHMVDYKKWFLRPPANVTPSPYLEECVCVLGAARPSTLSFANMEVLENLRDERVDAKVPRV